MKPFEKPMERSSQYSLVISSTPGCRCVFSPVRFWPCTVLKIPINKYTFKNLFTGMQGHKGGIWVTNSVSCVFMSISDCLIVLAITSWMGIGSVGQTLKPVACRWLKKKATRLVVANQHEYTVSLCAHWAQSRRRWNNVLETPALFPGLLLSAVFLFEHCRSRTSFITVSFCLQNAADYRLDSI